MSNKYWIALCKTLPEMERWCVDCGKLVLNKPHHFLWGNLQGKKSSDEAKRFVTSELNLVDLCEMPCHQNPQDMEVYLAFNIKKYGRPRFIEWLDTCPSKMRNSHYDKIVRLSNYSSVGKSWRPENTGGK